LEHSQAHLPLQAQKHVDPCKVKFFAVTVYSNLRKYRRRKHLYHRFAEMCEHAGVHLITVELAFGQRHFEVTEMGNPYHMQLRSHEEFWHKEQLINKGIDYGRRLFPNADRVAWIDCDCRPARPPKEWFEETWDALNRYQLVQMWEWLQPLDYTQNHLDRPNPSFMANYVKYGTPYPKSHKGYPVQWGSPGLAWAANISALDDIADSLTGPGVPDVAILGAGDWYLSHCLISTLPLPDFQKANYSPGYMRYWQRKQELCQRYIRRDVGYVEGLVLHDFHGPTAKRGYNTREKILINGQYDPYTDLKKDWNGLYVIETHELRQILMYDQIRAYFKQRDEDDIRSS
jgi:hypothetical protein